MAEEEVRILNSVISDLETELKTKGKTKQSRITKEKRFKGCGGSVSMVSWAYMTYSYGVE
jgi:hypothetical protein